MEKIRIGGIKLSNELAQVNLRFLFDPDRARGRLCGLLAEHRINIQYSTSAAIPDGLAFSCCVASEDEARVHETLLFLAPREWRWQFRSGVGLLSLYPHRSSLRTLSAVLQTLHEAQAPLLGLASSLSALTIVTYHDKLETAAARLLDFFELPGNHAPFQRPFAITQTSLVKPPER